MSKIKGILITSLLLCSVAAVAQSVISSAVSPDFVVGETTVGSSSTSGAMLTQGFLQGDIEVIPSGVNDVIVDPFKIKWNLYPNPLKSTLNISYTGSETIENTTLNVYSISGAIVFSTSISLELQSINLSALPAGIYNIVIINSVDNSIFQSNKIIKH